MSTYDLNYIIWGSDYDNPISRTFDVYFSLFLTKTHYPCLFSRIYPPMPLGLSQPDSLSPLQNELTMPDSSSPLLTLNKNFIDH
jgi:hypothetical protein